MRRLAIPAAPTIRSMLEARRGDVVWAAVRVLHIAPHLVEAAVEVAANVLRVVGTRETVGGAIARPDGGRGRRGREPGAAVAPRGVTAVDARRGGAAAANGVDHVAPLIIAVVPVAANLPRVDAPAEARRRAVARPERRRWRRRRRRRRRRAVASAPLERGARKLLREHVLGARLRVCDVAVGAAVAVVIGAPSDACPHVAAHPAARAVARPRVRALARVGRADEADGVDVLPCRLARLRVDEHARDELRAVERHLQ
mmetsp:Transcript_50696/g.110025  ORF Transcript_50696/g.110025 Transcript_50696/m.110025 type:complete len:257 (-) Transcript_50696:1041-1811(-)